MIRITEKQARKMIDLLKFDPKRDFMETPIGTLRKAGFITEEREGEPKIIDRPVANKYNLRDIPLILNKLQHNQAIFKQRISVLEKLEERLKDMEYYIESCKSE